MSKKAYKSQASSSRAVNGAFGGTSNGRTLDGGFGSAGFGAASASPLSYVYEPPDLSGLAEPNIIVAFKNVQKKDSTTKVRALEDLQAYVDNHANKEDLDEAFLKAWINVYPRTSIDNFRRVRQLSHMVQGQIAQSYGKRIGKHMTSLVGPWTAGLFDNDKSVVRAANESFVKVFASEEKRKNVWRLYQSSIIEYHRDVVVEETAATLSDERTTSPDDASAKYARVVGSSILVVSSRLDGASEAEIAKIQVILHDFFNQEKVWKLASYADPYVRRALYKLLVLALLKQRSMLNPSTISTHILTSGLHTTQVGSALDFLKAVGTLTTELPEVWTRYYSGSGKKSAQNRLCYFLKRGSQGAPPEFWDRISVILSKIPSNILMHTDTDENSDKPGGEHQLQLLVLDALHEGLCRRDEDQLSRGKAWLTFLNTFEIMHRNLGELHQEELVKTYLVPIFEQYIKPVPENSRWSTVGSLQDKIYLRTCDLLFNAAQLLQETLKASSQKIIEDIQTSQPEKSKEYTKSQDAVAVQTVRWYQIQNYFFGRHHDTDLQSTVTQNTEAEIKAAVLILENRNGKPYGAAASLEAATRLIPTVCFGEKTMREILTHFVTKVIPDLILSPSAKYMIPILDNVEGKMDTTETVNRCIQTLIDAQTSAVRSDALINFLSSNRLPRNELLHATIVSSLRHALKDNDKDNWNLVVAAIGNPAASQDLTDEILAGMTEGLSISGHRMASLQGLEAACKKNGPSVKEFALSKKGSALLSTLLALVDSSDEEVSSRAIKLRLLLEEVLKLDGTNDQVIQSLLDLINQGLSKASHDALPVPTLVAQAQKLVQQASPDDLSSLVSRLLPTASQWLMALQPFMARKPNISLAVTNSFGGALALISESPSDLAGQVIPRDGEGLSQVFRLSQYAGELIDQPNILVHATDEQQGICYKGLALFVQLAGDNLGIADSMPLWDASIPEIENEAVNVVAKAQALLGSWLQGRTPPSASIALVQDQLLTDSIGLTTKSYYSARAYSAITTELAESQVAEPSSEDSFGLKAVRNSTDVIAGATYLLAAQDSKELRRLCNELLADLTGHKFSENVEEGLRKLVLLSCIFGREEDYVIQIPQQRLVFFMKHLVQHLEIVKPNSILGAQITNVLAFVIPSIKEIYGSFWAELLTLIQGSGLQATNEEALFGVYTSLRILLLLRKTDIRTANDDLLDSWNESKTSLAAALVDLLKVLADSPDESHQPRRTINDLISRLLTDLSISVEVNESDLYPVLASDSAALQVTAYELSHRHIPSIQEQVSVDKALSKDYVAELPHELLSLILTAPTMEFLSETSFERTMPSPLRSYLLSWKLTFDHWQNASFKVQADYTTQLQEGSYVQDLLSLALHILVGARTKPVDASKFKIQSYDPGLEESPEKEAQWLFLHLNYLCLRYLPSITKTWWRDTASRQLNVAVESWTEKHFSPLIIASELSTISDWAPSQASADQSITVKTSLPAREISASIPVDEQTMTIAIQLPKSYPLARAEVKSVHRVGVAEKKWNAWLINTQGVINFSSGGAGEGNAIIDGLMAWRRNVTATMKGQTECAICYSVVGADRQLPNKKCQTCKNTFHSACLFRWFKSSNSSSCPLCRNAFHYS